MRPIKTTFFLLFRRENSLTCEASQQTGTLEVKEL